MLRANLQILTSDQGLGRYSTIPLEGKKSYKVANANNKSDSFSIIAVTLDNVQPRDILRRGATQSRIGVECQWLSDITISSATGKIYVNVCPVKEKQQLQKSLIGAASNLPTAKLITSAYSLGATLYNWYSPSTEAPEFEFSIGARQTKNTKFTYDGSIALGALWSLIESANAFADQTSLSSSTYQFLAKGAEMRDQGNEVYGFGSSMFKTLFG